MQPLYSVDHESRHNSNHAEFDREAAQPEESTPLLQRFPQYEHPRNPFTTIIVSLLLIILVVGIIIGIYLLVLQNDSENILPPVEIPLQLVSRSQWDCSNLSQPTEKSPYGLRQVMVVQTNTDQCSSTETCVKLLQDMQANVTATKGVLPYNFLISSNGQAYEGLGWHRFSPMLKKEPPNGLVLAFIGNFYKVAPTRPQMEAAKNFFAESVSQQYLHPSYRIIGKNVNDTPIYLSESLKALPQWNNELADNETN